MFLVKDTVLVLVSLVADPEARILGNTFREWGSEMWERRKLKRGECPSGAHPTEDLWESVGLFAITHQNVFQWRGQEAAVLSTNCQSVVGGGLLLGAVIQYLPHASFWVPPTSSSKGPEASSLRLVQSAASSVWR